MDKIYATLSADIVDSTSLSAADTIKLKELLDYYVGTGMLDAATRARAYFVETVEEFEALL